MLSNRVTKKFVQGHPARKWWENAESSQVINERAHCLMSAALKEMLAGHMKKRVPRYGRGHLGRRQAPRLLPVFSYSWKAPEAFILLRLLCDLPRLNICLPFSNSPFPWVPCLCLLSYLNIHLHCGELSFPWRKFARKNKSGLNM